MSVSKYVPFLVASILLFVLLLQPVPTQAHPANTPTKNAYEIMENFVGCLKGQSVKGIKDVKRYLHRFGYLNYYHANDKFDDLLESAIKAYQKFYHLNISGRLNVETLNQMMQPRCGVADVPPRMFHRHGHSSIHSISHFKFFPGRLKWPKGKTEFSYKLTSTATVPEPGKIGSIISNAFKTWSSVTSFKFHQVPASFDSDIQIGFHRFRSTPGVLAVSYPPTVGIFRYKADEEWSSDPKAGSNQVDLESVAVHEIGHLLGLGHSEVKQAVMYATYRRGTKKRNLHFEDKLGIRTLYGLQ